MFVFCEETSLVSVLPKNRWKGVRIGAGSSQWCQDKRQQSQCEIYEITPKHNNNLFVVQVDGQGSRLS